MSRFFGCRSFTTLSPIRMSPEVISSSPAVMRRAVVLPEPEGPTRTRNSPSATARLSESTARVPSENALETSANSIEAIVARYLQNHAKARLSVLQALARRLRGLRLRLDLDRPLPLAPARARRGGGRPHDELRLEEELACGDGGAVDLADEEVDGGTPHRDDRLAHGRQRRGGGGHQRRGGGAADQEAGPARGGGRAG